MICQTFNTSSAEKHETVYMKLSIHSHLSHTYLLAAHYHIHKYDLPHNYHLHIHIYDLHIHIYDLPNTVYIHHIHNNTPNPNASIIHLPYTFSLSIFIHEPKTLK